MPKMSVSEIRELVISTYDRIANVYSDTYLDNDNMDSKFLDYFIDRLAGGKVLDMGCGTGGNSEYLRKKGIDVVGIDASQNMLHVARRLYPETQFEEQDILQTSFNKDAFDGIVLAFVINHFNGEGLVLLKKEIDRLLKKCGVLFISAHIGATETIVPDPLDDSVYIYHNLFKIDVLDNLFSEYKKEYYFRRSSYGKEEFLCDKMFVVYKK